MIIKSNEPFNKPFLSVNRMEVPSGTPSWARPIKKAANDFKPSLFPAIPKMYISKSMMNIPNINQNFPQKNHHHMHSIHQDEYDCHHERFLVRGSGTDLPEKGVRFY